MSGPQTCIPCGQTPVVMHLTQNRASRRVSRNKQRHRDEAHDARTTPSLHVWRILLLQGVDQVDQSFNQTSMLFPHGLPLVWQTPVPIPFLGRGILAGKRSAAKRVLPHLSSSLFSLPLFLSLFNQLFMAAAAPVITLRLNNDPALFLPPRGDVAGPIDRRKRCAGTQTACSQSCHAVAGNCTALPSAPFSTRFPFLLTFIMLCSISVMI